MSPVVRGDKGDVNGDVGGFDLMEIRSATGGAGEGEEREERGLDVGVDSEGFVRGRRASAPRLFTKE
jgi:hypothetical protein